jgi:hypothetical protein
MRAHLESELRAAMAPEIEKARQQAADAAKKETELLKAQRQLVDREHQLSLDVERKVAEEAKRIRDHETRVAREHFAREAEERVRQKDTELAAAHKKMAEVAKREAELLKLQRRVTEREEQLALDVERRVADEAKKIREHEARLAHDKYAREAEERVQRKDVELAETRRKLAEAAVKEAAMLKRQRELAEREQQLALDVERKVAEEAKRIREDEARRADQRAELERDAQRLREEEHRLTIEGLKRHIEEMRQRANRGSQQVQGEAQEIALREVLADAFPLDVLSDVPKGMFGADVLQAVRTSECVPCGTIVWESKRTKAWSDDWLCKLRDDQRAAGAALAVIVTQVLPPDVKHFALRDGVWICAWPYASALASALRGGMTELALAQRSAENRGDKMKLLYDYLTGPEFRNRVTGFVEAFVEMQKDLEREKRAMNTVWKRRERQLTRARENITALYGDMQGIAGRQLGDLPALSLDADDEDVAAE